MANPDIGVEITGVEDIIKKLDQLEAKILKKYLRKALDSIAKELIPELKERAPFSGEGAHRQTHTFTVKNGDRRASYLLKHLRDSLAPYGGGGGKAAVKRKIVGNFYVRFLERGTFKMKAQPFIRPTMDGKAEQLIQEYIKLLATAIGEDKEDI